jgi:hypothetical protein
VENTMASLWVLDPEDLIWPALGSFGSL